MTEKHVKKEARRGAWETRNEEKELYNHSTAPLLLNRAWRPRFLRPCLFRVDKLNSPLYFCSPPPQTNLKYIFVIWRKSRLSYIFLSLRALCGLILTGPRTIMLQIYVGSARDLSAKNNQNTKTARLILRKKVDFARHQHDRNHGCNPTLSVSVVLVSRKVNFFT